jgi:hypothetical protein
MPEQTILYRPQSGTLSLETYELFLADLPRTLLEDMLSRIQVPKRSMHSIESEQKSTKM